MIGDEWIRIPRTEIAPGMWLMSGHRVRDVMHTRDVTVAFLADGRTLRFRGPVANRRTWVEILTA